MIGKKAGVQKTILNIYKKKWLRYANCKSNLYCAMVGICFHGRTKYHKNNYLQSVTSKLIALNLSFQYNGVP